MSDAPQSNMAKVPVLRSESDPPACPEMTAVSVLGMAQKFIGGQQNFIVHTAPVACMGKDCAKWCAEHDQIACRGGGCRECRVEDLARARSLVLPVTEDPDGA